MKTSVQSSATISQAALPLAARLLLGVLFVVSAIGKLGAPEGTQAYIAAAGLPAPELAYLGAVAFELAAGALLIAGFAARPVALALAGFTVFAALVFHSNLADANEFAHFLKNFAVAGGLLQVAATGAGRWSVDARRESDVRTGGLLAAR